MSKDATAAVGEGEEGGQPPINPAAMTGGSHVRARACEAAFEAWTEHPETLRRASVSLADAFEAGARWAEEQCAAIHYEEQVLWNQRWQEVGEIVTDAAALLRGYEAHHRAKASATDEGEMARSPISDGQWGRLQEQIDDAHAKADRNARMAERLEAWLVGVERPAVVARVRESGDHGETWVAGEEGPDAAAVGESDGGFREVVASLVREYDEDGRTSVDIAQRIQAYYREHPVEPARTLTERQYQCSYWPHFGVLTINASGEMPKSIEVNGKRYLPDQQKDLTDEEFGAEMMPEARCPQPPRERPVQEIESYDPVPVDRAVEPRVGAPDRHNDHTVDGFMVGTRWPDQPCEEWRGRHRPGGVADLTALRLTTGDPAFDPSKPVTVNGYAFMPTPDWTTLRLAITSELLRLRPSALAEGEQIDQACRDQADAILALLGLGDS